MWAWRGLAGLSILGVLGGAVHVLRSNAVAAARVRGAVRRPLTWLVGVPALLAVLVLGGPYVYLQSITANNPKALTFADLGPSPATGGAAAGNAVAVAGPTEATTTTTAPSAAGTAAAAKGATRASTLAHTTPIAGILTGAWAVGHNTQARYGVDDTVMGQTSRVVGATPDVTGAMHITDLTVTAVKVVVNMQTVTCHCQHDSKYRQMLEVDKYPTSQFDLTQPIVLPQIPPDGQVISVPVTGNFTIHGVTRAVSFSLQALRQAGRIAVNGTIPVKFEDYDIQNPNNAFGSVSNCDIEFLVAFDKTG
ncbi:MAG TPA: YceI family protein [Acidimicrobiales bacterium]|nr:YceI family protein [Acidimicrobiales bacterium]